MNTYFIIIISVVSVVLAMVVMYKARVGVDRLAEERRLEDRQLLAGEEELISDIV